MGDLLCGSVIVVGAAVIVANAKIMTSESRVVLQGELFRAGDKR